MSIKQVTCWQTSDGKTFDTQRDAEEHERREALRAFVEKTWSDYGDVDELVAWLRANAAGLLSFLDETAVREYATKLERRDRDAEAGRWR